MVLSGVFMYWYQALSPSGVKKLDQLFDLPLIADMRLRGIEVITENVHIVRLNILLNGNHISYKDAPVLMLKRESSMGDNSNDTETGQNTIYVDICDSSVPKNELILTRLNDNIRIQLELGTDLGAASSGTTNVGILAHIDYHP